MNPARTEYFDYLTARLDSGESKNIVIETASGLIKQKLFQRDIVRVLDVGCFSGAMLNRIGKEFSGEERNRLRLSGVDQDREVMDYGAAKYPDIAFVNGNLTDTLPLVRQYDLLILSNVLHEVLTGEKAGSQKNLLYPVFSSIVSLLVPGGSIIILDGVKPENADEKVRLNFVSLEQLGIFEKFSKDYKALKVRANLTGPAQIETDVASLAAFMTKARYMERAYWDSEAEQLYQYFTEYDFRVMCEAHDLKIERSEPQLFSINETKKYFQSTEPNIKIPAKNVLVVASFS